ncbi:MAG: HAMP domain-containing sensor histidine kinase [bacterium]
MKESNDFFLMTTHELRTSLTAMKWAFKMLADGDFGPINEQQHDIIERASQTNERMIALISDAITVVKNNSDDAVYVFSPINIGRLITQAVHDFTGTAKQKNIPIVFHDHIPPLMVSGDEKRLRIAIDNLVENAIKYGSNDSPVTITIESQDDTTVILSVENRGIGIPDADHARIFEKFFRASNTGEQTGTGLGLYTTKQVIERHKGTITFSGKEGVGTRFDITLPCAPHLE